MKRAIKRVLKALIPPFLLQIANGGFRSRNAWVGNFQDWDSAMAKSRGYSDQLILNRVAEATTQVIQGNYAFERDSVLFKEHDYNWSFLACLLAVAAKEKRLCVLDFGGSLGSSYWQNRAFFQGIDVEWHVVEQSHYVDRGIQEFENDTLKFHKDMDSVLPFSPNLVVFSSVLQYLSNPTPFLDWVLNSKIEYVLVDLTAIAEFGRICIQNVPPSIYPASYPCRVFHRESFLATWIHSYDTVAQWKCSMQPKNVDFSYEGFFFKRKHG